MVQREVIIKNFHGKGKDFAISVHGAEELAARLEALDENVQKKAANKALARLADRIVHAARALAPVGKYPYGFNSKRKPQHQRKKGTLRRAIKKKKLKRSRVRQGWRVHVDSKKFGAMPYYAPMVELGSPKRGIDAKPFLRPAALGVRERIVPIWKEELRVAINWAKTQKFRADKRKAAKRESYRLSVLDELGLNDVA